MRKKKSLEMKETEWKIIKLNVKKEAIKGKELFMEDPKYKNHPQAHKIVDCFDFIITNTT